MPQTTDQLKAAIMSLPCKYPDTFLQRDEWAQFAYKSGHRDARHAAAELVSAVPLVAEAPREPTRDEYHAANRCLDAAALHLTGTTQWPANWLALRDQFVGFIRAAKVAAPPVSLAPMPEPTDEQIQALWKNVATYRWQTSEPESLSESVRAFARAVLASVAPQPEQPNTDSVHLAGDGRTPVQGLDAADGVAIPDAPQPYQRAVLDALASPEPVSVRIAGVKGPEHG